MKLKIRGKAIALIVFLVLIISAAINVAVYNQFSSYITQSLLTSKAQLGMNLVEERIKGDWKLQDGKLYKGDTAISENFALVDDIKKSTEAECTIFMNDTRVATTVLKDGNRAVGTKAADNVIQAVLTKGSQYIGNATVVNRPYKAVYIPLKDVSGNTIGMFFSGVDIKVINSQVMGILITIMSISAILLIIMAILALLFVNKLIVNPLKQVSGVMEEVSKGDLKVRVVTKSNDEVGEIGRNLNKTLESLGGLMTGVNQKSSEINSFALALSSTSHEMASASQEIASSVGETAKGATEQAADLAKTMHALDNFNSALESIYGSMSAVKKGSALTEELSTAGSSKLVELSASINDIKSTFETTYNTVSALNTQVNKIDEIAATIKSISDQTNLLSLNAAIEAARAGEAGRGFAVVAQEIKVLADQSKQSTEVISQLVGKITTGAGEVITANDRMREKLFMQIDTIKGTTESFEAIIKSMAETGPMLNKAFKETDAALKEKDNIVTRIQSASSVAEESSAATEEISASTEEMTASTEEVAATAERLQQISKELVESVAIFKI